MKISLYILLIILWFLTPLNAQKTSEDYFGTWYTLGVNHRFTEHFSIMPYGEFRLYEPTSNYNLTFISFAANYHFKSNNTFSLGYAYLDIDSALGIDNQTNTFENRIYEQYSYTHQYSIFSVQHRFRLEQRFLQLVDKNEIQNRLRYRISVKYNINKTLFLAVKEEPFLNFQDQAFHENRFFIGLGFNILKNTTFEIDYLKHHIKKNNLNRIQVSLSIKTDLRKSKN